MKQTSVNLPHHKRKVLRRVKYYTKFTRSSSPSHLLFRNENCTQMQFIQYVTTQIKVGLTVFGTVAGPRTILNCDRSPNNYLQCKNPARLNSPFIRESIRISKLQNNCTNMSYIGVY
jgi:hypothetical protein